MPKSSNAFQQMVGVDFPLAQGPMNGASPVDLVTAVSNSGALGSFAAALLSPEKIIDSVGQIRSRTNNPFNVNLFVLDTPIGTDIRLSAQTRLTGYRKELGLAPWVDSGKYSEDFRDQVTALLEVAPPVVSFTFGLLDKETIAQFRRAGCVVIGTATTVAESQAWEAHGADLVCVSGSEAGGHRATFLGDYMQSCVGLMTLIPQVASSVKIPIVAAGGIMNGRGIGAALLLGAQAAQLGTAFLGCPESGIAQGWRDALKEGRDDSTRLTRTFSGRYARGIVNTFMREMEEFENEVLPYPIQNALTSEIRQAAAKQNRPELMSLWAGQGVAMGRQMSAAELVRTLIAELEELKLSQIGMMEKH